MCGHAASPHQILQHRRRPYDWPVRFQTTELSITTGARPGLFDLTPECEHFVAGAGDGLLNVFVPHATCGLVIMELGAGSDADFMRTLEGLLPRDDHWIHRHGSPGHGADHVVPALVPPSINVPVVDGRLALGTWQSIALVDTNVDNERRRVRLTLISGADG
jgi:secondary thiamine-phosphate synthase enzyme